MPFDFDAAVTTPFRMQPGLRLLGADGALLTPLEPGSARQREKLAVLWAFAEQALLCEAHFDAIPALHALAQHAAYEHPGSWCWNGRQAHALKLGLAVVGGNVKQLSPGSFGTGNELLHCLQRLAPQWRLPGLMSLAFEEDFAVIDAASGHVPFMAVALPSFWAPEEKVGRHFTAIHAPVADNKMLLHAASALMNIVSRDERWERFVWTITPHPHLHAHPQRVAIERWSGIDLDTLADSAYWRTEHQAFLPLPTLRQAVFTIHVQLQRLGSGLHNHQRAQAVHNALATMSPAVLAYRGLTEVREPLLRWLSSR